MPSRSRFAKRSSTRSGSPLAPLLVAAAVAAALLGAVGLTIGSAAVTGAGLFAGLVLAGRSPSCSSSPSAAATSSPRTSSRLRRASSSRWSSRSPRCPGRSTRRRSSTGRAPRPSGSSRPTGWTSRREPRWPRRASGTGAWTSLSPSAARPWASSRSSGASHSGAEISSRPRCSPTSPRAGVRERTARGGGAGARGGARTSHRPARAGGAGRAAAALRLAARRAALDDVGVALMHDAALAAIEDGRYDDAAKVVASALERSVRRSGRSATSPSRSSRSSSATRASRPRCRRSATRSVVATASR